MNREADEHMMWSLFALDRPSEFDTCSIFHSNSLMLLNELLMSA